MTTVTDWSALWHLPPSVDAAPASRRLVRPHLRRWKLDAELVSAVCLLVGELVAHAVHHVGHPIRLQLVYADGGITVILHHTGPPAATPLTPDAGAGFLPAAAGLRASR